MNNTPFEAGKTYKTRSGQEVYVFEVTEERIFCKRKAGYEWSGIDYYPNGRWYPGNHTSNLDLVRPKQVVWLNVYNNVEDTLYVGGSHDTKQEADKWADGDRKACIRIEVEQGQFDE